jgi:hypothetical protein
MQADAILAVDSGPYVPEMQRWHLQVEQESVSATRKMEEGCKIAKRVVVSKHV